MSFSFTDQCSRVPHLPLLAVSIALVLLGLGLSHSAFNSEWMLTLNHLTPGWDALWSFATQFGEGGAALLILLVLTRFSQEGTALALKVYLLGSLVSPLLKSGFAYPRPLSQFDPGMLHTIGQPPSGPNSMPSGHSMTVFATLAVLTVAFSLHKKIPWMAVLSTCAVLVGVSRVMVGAHWPADVLAGAGVGLWVTWLSIQWELRQPWQPQLDKKMAQWALLLTEMVLTGYLFSANTVTSAERLAFDLVATVGIAGVLSRLHRIRHHPWQ